MSRRDVRVLVRRLFVEILNSCSDCDEIQFKEDGSWAPMRSKKEVQQVPAASYNNGLDGEWSFRNMRPKALNWHQARPLCHPAGVCRTQASPDQHGSSSSGGGGKKVEVIDLTLDSSSDDEGQESSSPAPAPPLPALPPSVLPPPAKRACPSMSPTSPPIINKGSDPLRK